MDLHKAATLKPFHLDEKKSCNKTVSEATISKWKQVCLQNLRKEDRFQPYLELTWNVKQPNKNIRQEGDTNNQAQARATIVDDMLTYIAQYAPEVLFRDITKRCNSLKEVWQCVLEWANIKVVGSKHQEYNILRNSYVHNAKEMSPSDFFYLLRNAKEDCLLLANTTIQFKGRTWSTNEDLSPCLESDVVLDWVRAIGGKPLADQVF